MKKIIAYGLAAALGTTMLSAIARAQDTESQIPTSGEKVEGAPLEVKRDWGTFKLADRIAEIRRARKRRRFSHFD